MLERLQGALKVRHARAARVAAACAGLAALLCALGAPAPAAAQGSCSLRVMSASSQPACWRPFAANSVFNTPLPAHARLASDSSLIVRRMVARGWSVDGSNKRFDFSPSFYGTRPVFFATRSDPVMTIRCKMKPVPGVCTGANGVDVAGLRIHVPAGARPYANSDAHMTVIEKPSGEEYDFWDTTISGSTIAALTAGEVNVNTGNGLGSQGDAGQFGLSAGLVRPSELAAGRINHALVISVPCTNGSGHSAGFVFPAVQGDGAACGPNGSAATRDSPALGQLLRLNMTDAQIRSSAAPAWEKTIMTAWAHYGAYVEDTGGRFPEMDIFTQASSSWTDLGEQDRWAGLAQQLGASSAFVSDVPIPVSELQVVDPCVPEKSCTAAG